MIEANTGGGRRNTAAKKTHLVPAPHARACRPGPRTSDEPPAREAPLPPPDDARPPLQKKRKRSADTSMVTSNSALRPPLPRKKRMVAAETQTDNLSSEHAEQQQPMQLGTEVEHQEHMTDVTAQQQTQSVPMLDNPEPDVAAGNLEGMKRSSSNLCHGQTAKHMQEDMTSALIPEGAGGHSEG